MFKQVYTGLFVGASILGITGLVQVKNTQGLEKDIAIAVGAIGTASALTTLGLGVAYDNKKKNQELVLADEIEKTERIHKQRLSELESEIKSLKADIKALETSKLEQSNELVKLKLEQSDELRELKNQLNIKTHQYLTAMAEKDLKVSELQAITSERDTRIFEFLEDCRQHVISFLTLRNNNLDGIESAINQGINQSELPQATKESLGTRLIDIKKLRSELVDAIAEVKTIDITSFKTVLDFIFEFDNKFLNVKVRWKDALVKKIKVESTSLKDALDDSMPKPVAFERFTAGMDEVDERITEKYEALLLNNNSIHAQLLDLLEQRNLVIDDLQQNNDSLMRDVAELQKPLQAVGTSDYAVAANRVANYYYENYGYKLDVLNWIETEVGFNVLFATRRNPGLTETELLPHNTRQQLAAFTNALEGTLPKFEFNYQHSLLTLEIIQRKPVKKELTAQDLKFKDLVALGSKRSYLVTGHPGAGKTSTMIFLGQQLGGVDAMRVALNPHNDTKSSYERFGFVEINNLDAIVEQINLLYGEVKLRRDDPQRRHPLVICLDELSAVLDASEDAKGMMQIIRQIAVEGRKMNMIVIVGTHSQTTKAIDMDAEFRGAFYQLFLVGSARNAIDQPHRKTYLKPVQEQWIRETAYPVLLLANAQYSLVKHPTHGDYEEYKDEGNYPENLEDWDINQLSVAVSNSVKVEYTVTQSSTHVLPNVTATTTQVENHYPEPHSKGSESYPAVKTVKITENNGEKGESDENLGSETSKALEPLIDKTSGYNSLPVLTQGEIELLNKYNYEPISTVIKKVWDISPSKYPSYLNRKAQVENFRKQSKGAK